MTKISRQFLWVSPTILSTVLLAGGAIAEPLSTIPEAVPSITDASLTKSLSATTLEPLTPDTQDSGAKSLAGTPADSTPENSIEQVTSVSELSDVQPTDWAFQAVQSLVERYGCIEGYPDKTFRGNRAATRYELAAALNACLNQISERFVTAEDLATIRSLQEEFAVELATLRGRVDTLEARTAELQANQFSTTTKLQGEAIFAVSGLTGEVADENPATDDDINANVTFTARTRLNFLTSFTGKDRLFTRLQASNRSINFDNASQTFNTRLSFDTGDTNSEVRLDRLDYMFPVGEKLKVTVFGNGAFHHYYAATNNPFFEGGGGGKGSISWFGERNPIYRIGTVGYPRTSGIGTSYQFNPAVRLDLGYLAGRADSALPGAFGEGGLIGGTYSALAQLSFKPAETLDLGLTYVRNYAPDGNLHYFAGSPNANVPFGGPTFAPGTGAPLTSNSFGAEASWLITPQFALGGWFGYTDASRVDATGGSADIFNYAVNLAFPNLFKEGALGGLIFGMPPKATNNTIAGREDPDTTYHLEALYQFPIAENITVTPGVIYLINPDQDASNGDVFVGVLRTVFSF